ncbi:hypothetical protein OIO90_005793 [Microbotryomycetes sp. JL221]|nr:hypothetical protein OIO90_005793 [Microbotryomycetes sp. JL221]
MTTLSSSLSSSPSSSASQLQSQAQSQSQTQSPSSRQSVDAHAQTTHDDGQYFDATNNNDNPITPDVNHHTLAINQLTRQLEHAHAIRQGAHSLLHKLDHDNDLAPSSSSSSSPSAATTNDNLQLRQDVENELRDATHHIQQLEQQLHTLQHERTRLSIPDSGGAPSAPSPALSANSFDNLDPFINNSTRPSTHMTSTNDSVHHDRHERQLVTHVVQLLSSLIDQTSLTRLETLDETVDLLRRHVQIKLELDLDQHIQVLLECLSDNESTLVRANVYRVLRYLVVDQTDVQLLRLNHIDLFLIRCFARDETLFEIEKQQALKFVRTLMIYSVADVDRIVPVSIVRAIVSLAENNKDRLSLFALETLGELLLRDISLLVHSGGLRIILQTLSQGPFDLSLFLTNCFNYIMDKPGTRQYLRPGVDVEVTLTNFTDVSTTSTALQNQANSSFQPQQKERVETSAKNILSLLKSWSGLMYFNLYNKRPLRTLVESLTSPSIIIRDTLIDMFFNLFHVTTPDWYQSKLGLKSKRLEPIRYQNHRNLNCNNEQIGASLIDQYLSIVLLMFIDAGLLDVSPLSTRLDRRAATDQEKKMVQHVVQGLVALATKTTEPVAARSVSLLISEVLHLANKVLPLNNAAHAQALPKLFELTTKFDTSDSRLNATNTLTSINHFNRLVGQSNFSSNLSKITNPSLISTNMIDNINTRTTTISSSTDHSLKSGQRQLDETKFQQQIQIDEQTFKNLLLETNVLTTKDEQRWNLNIIFNLLKGSLLNSKRFEETIKITKFFKRLIGLFWPLNFKFSRMKNSKYNYKWTMLGCQMLTTMLASPDGIRYLYEDKFLPQIVDCLNQLDPLTNQQPQSSTLLFSKQRMETTMVGGYFDMIGTLSKHSQGLKLLNHFKMFSTFYRISELKGRDDLYKALIVNLDYSEDGHARVLLSKALTASHKTIRLFATQHLSTLMFPSASSSNNDNHNHIDVQNETISDRLETTTTTTATSNSISLWQIKLLLIQIYDPAFKVCSTSIDLLEKACFSNFKILEQVVELKPNLDHLGSIGIGLLTRFLSTTIGVNYLVEIGFINQMLDDWYFELNESYVIKVELQLSSILGVEPLLNQTNLPTPSIENFDRPPPHFYGELVKTEKGCQVLESSGHFIEFVEFLRENAMEDFEQDIIFKLKVVLWAIGHIGSTQGGLDFVDREDILETIVDVAEESPVFSLRGTAFFALGLIASTVEGVEMLEDLGWQGVLTPLGQPTGLVVPMELGNFVDTPLWDPPTSPVPQSFFWPIPQSHTEQQILTSIANLSNHILSTKSSKQFIKLKSKNEIEIFKNFKLIARILELLNSYHYRSNVRTFVIESFSFVGDVTKGLNDKMSRRGDVAGGGGGVVWDATFVRKVGQAIEELNHQALEEEQGVRVDSDLTETRPRRRDVQAATSGTISGDEPELSSSDRDEEELQKMPIKVMKPLLTVKGFLLS